MIALEFKAKGKSTQYSAIDEAIRTAQFIRNKAVRFWMDHSKNALTVVQWLKNLYPLELMLVSVGSAWIGIGTLRLTS